MKKKLSLKTPEKLKTPQGRRYLAVILTFLLGIFITIAIKQNDKPELLASAREGELVLILDDLTKQKDLLEEELIRVYRVQKTFVDEKGLDFIFDYDYKINYNLIGDYHKLRQIILNILSNAIKYTNKGYIKLKTKQIEFDEKPMVEQVSFNPIFKENLFFVHLNEKQDSKEGIAKFRESNQNTEKEIEMISAISDRFLEATSLEDFDTLIVEHERIISSIIKLKPVKERLFPDYFGEIKSLGAWGGDFILATGNSSTPDYFKNRGFETILSYSEMVL